MHLVVLCLKWVGFWFPDDLHFEILHFVQGRSKGLIGIACRGVDIIDKRLG